MNTEPDIPSEPNEGRQPLDPSSVAAQEIRMVARTFRWTALAGLAFSAAMLFQAFQNIRVAQDKTDVVLWWALVPTSVVLGGAFFGLMFATNNLCAGHPSGRKQALLACHLMFVGIPLFTIVGWICKQKIIRHYDDYLKLLDENH